MIDFKIITRDEQKRIITEDYDKCALGWFFPNSAKGALGARLIFDRGGLTVIGDRVARRGTDVAADQAVGDMTAKTKLVKALEKFLRDNGVSTKDDTIIYGDYLDFRVLATPNGSYGYVYLSAWTI